VLGEGIRPKCAYAGRCAFQLGRICVEKEPPWQNSHGGVAIRFHIPIADLIARTTPDKRRKAREELPL
jgi:hypothetical protein